MVGYVIAGLTWASIGALLVCRRPTECRWLADGRGRGGLCSARSSPFPWPRVPRRTLRRGDRSLRSPDGSRSCCSWSPSSSSGSASCIRTAASRATVVMVHAPLLGYGALVRGDQPDPARSAPADSGLDNPIGFGPDLRGGRPIAPILALWTIFVFVALGSSMVSRYRSAGIVERQQIKWFVLALGMSSIALGFVTIGCDLQIGPVSGNGLTVYVFAGPSSRSRSASPSCATASSRSTGSSVGRSPTRCVSRSSWPSSSSGRRAASGPSRLTASPRVRRSRWPARRWSSSRSSSRSVGGSDGVDRRFDGRAYDAERTATAFDRAAPRRGRPRRVEAASSDAVDGRSAPTREVWLRAHVR